MVSYDVLGPGGRGVLHAQTPFVESDVRRPFRSAGKLTQKTSSETRTHGSICKATLEYNACLCE